MSRFSYWVEDGHYYKAMAVHASSNGPHDFDSDGTSDCKKGCGCWMGPARSGGPVDPFGPCPRNPKEGYTPLILTGEKVEVTLTEYQKSLPVGNPCAVVDDPISEEQYVSATEAIRRAIHAKAPTRDRGMTTRLKVATEILAALLTPTSYDAGLYPHPDDMIHDGGVDNRQADVLAGRALKFADALIEAEQK
jgi:hypothetical protein